MAGDIEHIEGIILWDDVDHRLVEDDGDKRENRESGNAGPGFLEFEILAHIDRGVDAKQDLGAMMDHGLDADADGWDEDVVWIDIDDEAAKESKGGGEIHAGASDPISDLVIVWKEGN